MSTDFAFPPATTNPLDADHTQDQPQVAYGRFLRVDPAGRHQDGAGFAQNHPFAGKCQRAASADDVVDIGLQHRGDVVLINRRTDGDVIGRQDLVDQFVGQTKPIF